MADRPGSSLDLLALAEDVASGRRSLDNVIDQISVSTPDDRERRTAVAELQALVLGLTGVRAHARATEAAVAAASAPGSSLVVAPRRVVARGRRWSPAPFAAVATALVGVVVIAIIATSLRPAPTVGGPSPSLPAGVASGSPSPLPSATEPDQSFSPTTPPTTLPTTAPTVGPTQITPIFGDRAVFWTRTETSLTVWSWQPFSGTPLQQLFAIDTYDMPLGTTYQPTVLVSPDGARIAIGEHGYGDPASHDRTRVFDLSGHVLWTSGSDVRPTVSMAWSADGSKLALAGYSSPWTVLTFETDGSAAAKNYDLPSATGYGLIAFTSAGNLVGYDGNGNAAFWQKPVLLDLSSGQVSTLTAFPAHLARNATGPIAAIDEETGRVLVYTPTTAPIGGWSVAESTSSLNPLPIDGASKVTWAGGDTIVEAGEFRSLTALGASASPRSGVSLLHAALDAPGVALGPVATFDDRSLSPIVVRDGVALLMHAADPTTFVDNGSPGATAVDLATGNAESIDQGPLWYAGWIGAGSEPQPAPSASPSAPSESPSAPSPSAPPATPSAPASTPSIPSPTPFNVDASPAAPGAPNVVLWSTGVVPGKITLWKWSPSHGTALVDWLDLDTWSSGTFEVSVVVSPDGSRIAVTEFGGPGSTLNRTRVFAAGGLLLWASAAKVGDIIDVAWSPDSTKLAIGAVPSPWSVVTLGTGGDVTASTYA
jgi:hypothetical protein